MSKVVSLGIHIVDVLGRPVASVPAGQGLALLDLIRFTVAGTAAGTSIDMAACGGLVIQGLGSDAGIENFEQVLEFARTAQIKA